jgi:predicted N-acetyltransferase YhbS
MDLRKIPFTENEFLRIRDFLVNSYQDDRKHHNWLIDRWNFCRFFSQPMHGTFNSWPESVGIWVNEGNEITAVVNSEGENRGEAFFQFGNFDLSGDHLDEFIDHAESHLPKSDDSGALINLRVNEGPSHLKEMLKERGYQLQDWREANSSLMIDREFVVDIPDGFEIARPNEVSDHQKGLAHGKAFGYHRADGSSDESSEGAYAMIRNAPDYDPGLDISIIDIDGEVASFATVWYDEFNRIGMLEPVGTIPKYRNLGLGKAVVFEGMNRIGKRGARKMYVGSDQEFYLSMGFEIKYTMEIWQKRL